MPRLTNEYSKLMILDDMVNLIMDGMMDLIMEAMIDNIVESMVMTMALPTKGYLLRP